MSIDPTAYVDKTAIVSETALIGPRAYIGKGCVIGDNVQIGLNAVVECHTEIGEGTVLSPNAHVGGAPQDYSFKNEDTKLIIGKNCIIREFAPIHRATTKGDWKTEIGDGSMIMALSHVGHDCKFGKNVTLASSTMISGHVQVGDYAVISGYAGIHQWVRIGTMAMISGLSHVGHDVPPYCVAVDPARSMLGGLNAFGMKRRGVSSEAMLEVKRAFAILVDTSILMADVKEKLKELHPYPEVETFRNFIEAESKRGIARRIA